MKKFILSALLPLLILSTCLAADVTPINNGLLQSALNANEQQIINALLSNSTFQGLQTNLVGTGGIVDTNPTTGSHTDIHGGWFQATNAQTGSYEFVTNGAALWTNYPTGQWLRISNGIITASSGYGIPGTNVFGLLPGTVTPTNDSTHAGAVSPTNVAFGAGFVVTTNTVYVNSLALGGIGTAANPWVGFGNAVLNQISTHYIWPSGYYYITNTLNLMPGVGTTNFSADVFHQGESGTVLLWNGVGPCVKLYNTNGNSFRIAVENMQINGSNATLTTYNSGTAITGSALGTANAYATVTVTGHTYQAGDLVFIQGVTDPWYDGPHIVSTNIDASDFTFQLNPTCSNSPAGTFNTFPASVGLQCRGLCGGHIKNVSVINCTVGLCAEGGTLSQWDSLRVSIADANNAWQTTTSLVQPSLGVLLATRSGTPYNNTTYSFNNLAVEGLQGGNGGGVGIRIMGSANCTFNEWSSEAHSSGFGVEILGGYNNTFTGGDVESNSNGDYIYGDRNLFIGQLFSTKVVVASGFANEFLNDYFIGGSMTISNGANGTVVENSTFYTGIPFINRGSNLRFINSITNAVSFTAMNVPSIGVSNIVISENISAGLAITNPTTSNGIIISNGTIVLFGSNPANKITAFNITANGILSGAGQVSAGTQFVFASGPTMAQSGNQRVLLGKGGGTTGMDGELQTSNVWLTGICVTTNGIGSYATNSTMTCVSTGCTNSTGIIQYVYVTAGTSVALTNLSGAAEFYGQTIAAFTPIRMQNGSKLVGTAITYSSGESAQGF